MLAPTREWSSPPRPSVRSTPPVETVSWPGTRTVPGTRGPPSVPTYSVLKRGLISGTHGFLMLICVFAKCRSTCSKHTTL